MNRLSSEKSPYLLQHAGNPVEWYAWGEEAFGAARAADKPIFLSVGYSTCHWCHVMAHESFESARIAEVLNEHFVAIKVDREERPDVDRLYMTFVQATTGGGGWPMSVWLTPDLQPFYGGTYYPPASRWGRPGFVDLLLEIARLWREDRARVLQSAKAVGEQLAQATAAAGGTSVPGVEALQQGVAELRAAFDERYGGFGGAPKFPRPSELLFLLREFRRTADAPALNMVVRTLQAMARGGMRDHIGGGFHRYSVDAQWRVPHFEKMLYDQAQLALAYLEAAQASQDLTLLEVAQDTLRYVQRDMTDTAGGFYSAEDADSLPEGAPPGAPKAEGAFYLWSAAEIESSLGVDAPVVQARYDVRANGNALQDPQGEFGGQNILYAARSVEDIARDRGGTVVETEAILGRARRRLFEARARRPRPHLDDKVLTAWNGLMIAAFARAARVVPALRGEGGESRAAATGYLQSARRAAAFIREHMWDAAEGRLFRRYRQNDAAIDGYAEDYAGLVFGLLDLFEADGDAAWLEWATHLQRRQDDLFWDAAQGGWFGTTGADPSVRLRLKEDYDGAEPAASSIGVHNLLRLAHLTGDAGMTERLEQAFRLFAPRLESMGRAVPMMLAALSLYRAGIEQIVIVADEPGQARPLLDVVGRTFLPFAVLIPVLRQDEALGRLMPMIGAMKPREGRATAYVCRAFACQAPTTDPEQLERALRHA
jgi:uncharacterized protein YyaL (SSP411 family)